MKAILALSLLLICAALVQASPPGKPQQLTSPDQVPEGLAKSDWSSIRAAYEAGRHAFQPIEGGWQARNPGQQWTTKFDGRGFIAQPKGAGWQWGLELKSYGFGETQTAISGTPAVKAKGQCLYYQWDATVQEWWINDKRGLEHGFTVKERPAGAGELQFDLAVRGTLKPQITADALAVLFQDAAGATVLNYTGLKVWDADGKVLASRFEAAGENGLRLLVEEYGARYPLTIDPIAQQAYLKAHQVNTGDNFGYSVAVSDDTVVVGAYNEASSTTGINSTANENASDAGAAYVFVRSGKIWTQQAYLKAHQVNSKDLFGYSVAVSGDTVVVGAYQEDSGTTGVGGIPNESTAQAGAAYVFVRSGTNWTQQAYLKAHQVNASDSFGYSVAVSGDTVVVGGINEDSSTTGVDSTPNESSGSAGAAYVFVRSGTNWTQQAYLKAHQVTAGDQFGYSVAVSGDTVVVGANSEDSSTTGVNSMRNESASGAGAAYVFVCNGANWTQQAYLKPHQVNAFDQFGWSVAVSGETVVVGARGEDSSTLGVNGTANEDVEGSGAAYVFVRSGTDWMQQAYLKAHQVNWNDQFGYSVAVSGDTLVVGAINEDSNTTGLNSTPNESGIDAGAAYVFVRSGSSWTQQAYLKPPQANDDDWFGRSVAVSGDTVIVGADNEDSSTSGINSTPNESASSSGAAYVFDGGGDFNVVANVESIFLPQNLADRIQSFGMTEVSTSLLGGGRTLFSTIEIPSYLILGGTGRVESSRDMVNWLTVAVFGLDSQKVTFQNTVPVASANSLFYRTVYEEPTVAKPPTSRFLEFPLREVNLQTKRSPYTHRIVGMQDHNGASAGFQAFDGRLFTCDSRKDEGVPGFAHMWEAGDDPEIRVDLTNPDVSVKRISFPRLNYDEKLPGQTNVTHVFYDNHTGYDFADQGAYTVANKPIFCTRSGTLYAASDKTTSGVPDVGGVWRKQDATHPARLQDYTTSGETQWSAYHAIYVVHDNGYSSWFLHCDRLPGQAGNYGTATDHPGTTRNLFSELLTNGFANVTKGEVIAYVGEKGAGAAHLHFGVRKRPTDFSTFHSDRADPFGKTGTTTSPVLWEETPPQ